jgi:hypothetical protein
MNPTAPEKKSSRHNPQHAGWLIRRSPTQFLSQNNHWSSNDSQTSVDNKLHQFTGPITPACDRYVQYLLARDNLLCLIDIGGCYNHGGVNLSHHTPRPSQLMVLRFPPKGPAQSQVNNPTLFQLNQDVINPKSHEWDLPVDFYLKLPSKHSIANSKPPR